MKLPIVVFVCLVLAQLVGSRSASEIQKATPLSIPATQVLDAVKNLTTYADILPAQDTIKGDRYFDQTVVAANVLTFEPGSRVIFRASVLERADRFVFARTVRVGGSGGTITWDREPSVKRAAPPVGKAPPGNVGGGEGEDGQLGADGQPGNPGYPGLSGPTIYLVVNRIEGGPLEIDLRGQDGGDGGKGQTGGDGGFGRPGTAAMALLSLCRRSATTGGHGGSGGRGGPGGEGGRGGNGGNLVLLTPEAALERLAAMLYVDVRPGQGGKGGNGGDGGEAGEPGPAGRAESPCAPASSGKPGAKGQGGPDGSKGPDGQAGLFVKTALTEQQVRSLQLRGEARK